MLELVGVTLVEVESTALLLEAEEARLELAYSV